MKKEKMKPLNIIEGVASCATNGKCKAQHCELWDQYSHTCSIRAMLFELREQTRELKDRRKYLTRKTVEELGEMDNEEMFSCEETLRQRNSDVLQMYDRNKDRDIQNEKDVSADDGKKQDEIYCPQCKVKTGGVKCWVCGCI